MKDTETTVQRKVVFLTESGHPPTNEVAEAYLNLFAGEILKDLHGTKNAITQNATAGPYWNSPKNLIPIIQTNPKELYLAIFGNSTITVVLTIIAVVSLMLPLLGPMKKKFEAKKTY